MFLVIIFLFAGAEYSMGILLDSVWWIFIRKVFQRPVGKLKKKSRFQNKAYYYGYSHIHIVERGGNSLSNKLQTLSNLYRRSNKIVFLYVPSIWRETDRRGNLWPASCRRSGISTCARMTTTSACSLFHPCLAGSWFIQDQQKWSHETLFSLSSSERKNQFHRRSTSPEFTLLLHNIK